MAIRKSIRQPRVHPSTQQRTSRGPSTPTYSPLDNGQPGEGVLSITQILSPPVVHVDLPSQAPSSSFTWILEDGKPSERHERRSGSPRKRAGQGKSDDEELVRTPLIRSRTLESLPPPIPSPPWSRSHQSVLDDMPPSQKYNDLDKRKCRYNSTPGSRGVSLTSRGQEGYSTDDSEYEGSSSRLKNARADALALAHFREIVESRRVADRSSSDSDDYDPCSRVSTPEGYPEALRNRYKRPRSKSWDRSQLPRSKRQKPWVPTNVVRRAGSDIEMADPAQRDPMDVRQSPGPSCSFAADNDIKMNCVLPSTASSGQSSDPVSFPSPPVDHLDSGAEALNSSSGRFHCPEPGCTASYHSLWAYNRHQAKHQESLHSDTVAVNCSKCGTARKQVGSHTTVESQIRRCSFGCQLSFSHLWKKELHEDRIHKGKALEPSMCRECGAKPTDLAEPPQKMLPHRKISIASICSTEPMDTTEESNQIAETTAMQPPAINANPEDLRSRLSTSSRQSPSNPPPPVSHASPAPLEPPIMTPINTSKPLIFVQVQPMEKYQTIKFRQTIVARDGKSQTFAI